MSFKDIRAALWKEKWNVLPEQRMQDPALPLREAGDYIFALLYANKLILCADCSIVIEISNRIGTYS